MPRLTRLEDVLFPVKEHPVFASVDDATGERRLPVPEKKAIVNSESHCVLGIVSRGYRLVSNREALDLAHKCCRTVFPETKQGEWEVEATDAPGTGGHCYIHLVHNSTALDFSFVPTHERPDVFGPFICVTNSYNGSRALAFDIGFYRKVCTNGLILPESIIRFKFTHQRREIGETIEFEVARERLAKFKTSFGRYLGTLRECPISRGQFVPLICGVLLRRQAEPLKPNTREAEEWAALNAHLRQLSDRYARELGENAYAAFNAITEFASHPPANRRVRRDRHSLQRLAGAWVNSFSQQCRQPGFNVDAYIGELTKLKSEATSGPHTGRQQAFQLGLSGTSG